MFLENDLNYKIVYFDLSPVFIDIIITLVIQDFENFD